MRSDALRRREALVAHAKRLFAERGGDVALEAVAAASGVGIATLYRNFPSREELIVAVSLDIVERIASAVAVASGRLAEDAPGAWRGLVDDLVGMDLGALTDALARSERDQSLATVAAAERQALRSLDALLESLEARETVREGLVALEVVVAISTLTRPQPEAVRLAAPAVKAQLVDAYVSWSTAR